MTRTISIAIFGGLSLAGCTHDYATRIAPAAAETVSHGSIQFSRPSPVIASTTGSRATIAEPAIRPSGLKQLDLVGRWGYGSYLRDEDRERTIAMAESACSNPYLIGQGENGGVIMHLADKAEPIELAIRGSDDGRDYIGPGGPPGGQQDRFVESFDGRVLILRWVSTEVASRYGAGVFVRCSQGR